MKGSNLRRKNKLSLKQLAIEKTYRGIPPRPQKVAVSTECTVSNMPTIRNQIVEHICNYERFKPDKEK